MISNSNINTHSTEVENKAHINGSDTDLLKKKEESAYSRAMVTKRLLDILNKYSKEA